MDYASVNHRHRDRQRGRQTDRQTDRRTHRETDRNTKTDSKQAVWLKHPVFHQDRRMDRTRNRHSQTDTQTERAVRLSRYWLSIREDGQTFTLLQRASQAV